MDTQQLWLLFGTGFVASLVLAPLFIKLAGKLGVVDHPGHRKIHRQPIPYLGGVVIFAAFSAALGLHLAFYRQGGASIPFKNLSILAVSLGLVVLGLWDDFYGMRAREK